MSRPTVNHLSKILCVFCGEPWNASNIRLFELDAANHCDSGRFGPETCTVQIRCHACARTIYQKGEVEFGGSCR